MADLDALFGSSDSEEGGEEPQQRAETQQRQKDDLEDSDDEQPKARQQQAARQLARSGSGDDEEEDGAAGKRRDANAGNPQGGAAEAPMVLHPVPDNTSVCLIRTTNVIAFQPRPFDPATFEVEEDTCLDATGKYRVPRPVEAVVRWRVRRLPDGSEARESNARFVRWEDGTLTLMLGSEVLDLPERDISESNQYVFTVTGAGAPFQVSSSNTALVLFARYWFKT
jgi:RNA polymerase-associated protein LEO1